MVEKWLHDNGQQLKIWQDSYMRAEKELKGGLISLIDPMTASLKAVKTEKKKLNGLLKGRCDTEGARKSITKLLLLIDGSGKETV